MDRSCAATIEGIEMTTNRPTNSVPLGELPRMDLEELRDDGWLQEVNRQWFHPRGLALAVVTDTGWSERLWSWLTRRPTRHLVVLDDRTDPEGWMFNYYSGTDPEGPFGFIRRAQAPNRAWFAHRDARKELFGDAIIQPLPTTEDLP